MVMAKFQDQLMAFLLLQNSLLVLRVVYLIEFDLGFFLLSQL